jgi:hypothetical protein
MPISVNHSNKIGSILLRGPDQGNRKKRIFNVSPACTLYAQEGLFIFILLLISGGLRQRGMKSRYSIFAHACRVFPYLKQAF